MAHDPNDMMRIHHALSELNHRYFWLVDHGRAAEVADLFTPDGKLTFGPTAPTPGTIEGTAIATAMRNRQAQTGVTTRHVCSNLQINTDEGGHIIGRSVLTLFRSDIDCRDPAPLSVADIEDIYVKIQNKWYIEDRFINPIFYK